ncbi:MAG: MFS transporter [Holosporales bacterium]|jgi:MHS family proline/betaine transporter-like MFS transporter|nr:MFS transporter [Holosporales bacterium]
MNKAKIDTEFQAMKKVIFSCIAGSSLEWYDFALYGYFAALLGRLFFPSGDEFQQLIASFGAFASGLIARPVGAVMFGYIGDIWGRKKALIVSIYMMAIPTAAMALLPTYEYLGIWSGVLLTMIRIVQGLALGGGFTGTMVFIYEHSSEKRRGTYSSWAPFSLVFGFVLGAVIATVVGFALDNDALESWGWRVPFGISFIGTFIAKYVQKRLSDPKEFLDAKKQKAEKEPLLRSLFSRHWRALILVVVIDILTACGYFLLSVFIPTYFDKMLDFGMQTSFLITSINMVLFSLSILLGGWLSDRFGKRKQMIVASILLALLVYPLFLVMKIGPISAMLSHFGLIFLFSIYYGPIPAAICSVFPVKTRLIGVSVAHNFAMAAFGAYAPTLATYLIKWSGNISIPAVLFVISALLTAAGLYVWEEGKSY